MTTAEVDRRAWMRRLHGDLSQRARRRLRLAFLAALYLFAASYGMHEPAD